MKFREYMEKAETSRIDKLAIDNNVIIISAYGNVYSGKENEDRHSQLKEDVKNVGYLIELRGTYEYDGNMVSEKYLAVIDADEDILKDIISRYDQKSYITVDENGYKIKDISGDTKFEDNILIETMKRFHIKDKEAFERYTYYVLECERWNQNHRYSSVNKWEIEVSESRDLNEASLSRIYKHTKDLNSWSILTSYTDDKSRKENIETFKKLEHDVRSMGLGFIKLQGVGQEKDKKTGEIIEVEEKSMFIPKITKKQAEKLAKKYKQTAFVYYGPETNNKISLVWTDIDKMDKIGSFHPGKIAQFYSKIKGRPFVFESVISNSWFEGLARSLRRKGVR